MLHQVLVLMLFNSVSLVYSLPFFLCLSCAGCRAEADRAAFKQKLVEPHLRGISRKTRVGLFPLGGNVTNSI